MKVCPLRGPREARTPEYVCWTSMRQRCFNPKNSNYKHYGARGISICSRWAEFENFHADMGFRPVGHSIERKNVNGNYCPSNCLWIPDELQSGNKTTTRWVHYKGDRLTLAQACRRSGVSKDTVLHRVSCGLTYEQALVTQMPRGPRVIQLFSFQGRDVSMRELCDISGKSRGALYYLIVTAGYTPEKAVLS